MVRYVIFDFLSSQDTSFKILPTLFIVSVIHITLASYILKDIHIITTTLWRDEPISYFTLFFMKIDVLEKLGARMALRVIMFERGKLQKTEILIYIKILLGLSDITRMVLRAPPTRMRTINDRVQKGQRFYFEMFKPTRQVPEKGKLICLVIRLRKRAWRFRCCG